MNNGFTLQSTYLNALAQQAFNDLTDEHNARVFLSNVIPARYMGCQQHDEAQNSGRIVFDLLLDEHVCTKNRIKSILNNVKDSAAVVYAIDSIEVSSDDFYHWPKAANSCRVITISLSASARLSLADGCGYYADSDGTPYIKLYTV